MEESQLDRIEGNQARIEAQVVEVSIQISRLSDQTGAILTEIGGVPDPRYRDPERRSLRYRLHHLEASAAASRIMHEAFSQSWTVTQKTLLFVFAAIGAIVGVLHFFV